MEVDQAAVPPGGEAPPAAAVDPGAPPAEPQAPPAARTPEGPANPYPETDWRHGVWSGLSSDEKAVKALAKFKEPGAAVKSLVELEKFQGDSIRIPKGDAKPEEWRSLWSKLGAPPSAMEYNFERPALPKDVTLDPKAEQFLLQAGYEAGLTNQQMAHLFSGLARTTVAEAEAAIAERRQAEAALVKEWGIDYDKRLALAKKAMETAGGGELKQFMAESGMGNNPTMIKAFYALGQMMAEAGYVVASVGGITTAEAAAEEVARLMRDPAYYDGTSPNHKEIVAKVNKLQQLRFPGRPAA